MKTIIYFIFLFAVLFLSGCAKSDLTQLDLTANNDMAKATKACYEARKIDLTGVPKDAIGYIVMSKQFGDALLAVTGNDPCRSTNVFDVQIAEVQAKNKSLQVGTGNILDLGKWVVGGVVATAGFDAMGDTATGNANMNKSNYDKSGNVKTDYTDSYNESGAELP